MSEYQIFVDAGPVSFGTQWDSDKAYTRQLALFMYDKFGAENVTVFHRCEQVSKAKGIDAIEEMFG